MTYAGPDRRQHNRGRRHSDYARVTLRYALIAWIIGATLFTAIEWYKISSQKASVDSLQKTNNALVQFLCTARTARIHTAINEKDSIKREADLKAAAGYTNLINAFGRQSCK